MSSSEVNGVSLPMASAHEPRLGFQNRNNGKKGTQKSLTTVVLEDGQQVQADPSTNGKSPGSWPTPNARRAHAGVDSARAENRTGARHQGDDLKTKVHMWNTPRAGGKLNPNWVEQLMGLSVGWTQLSVGWKG